MMGDPLPYPDRMHLQFARGWLELGCTAEAARELAGVGPTAATSAEALDVRFQLLVRERRFSEALPLAWDQFHRFPAEVRGLMNVGNVLFWLGRPDEAVEVVLPAVQKHPGEAVLLYNLACYYVSLGDPESAKDWIRKALAVGHRDRVIQHALIDDDLRDLWPWLQSLEAATRRVGEAG